MTILGHILTAITVPLVYEFIGHVRKLMQLPYVPIYFQFLPLDVLNRDLSIYLGDDFWMGYGEGPKISKQEAKRLKQRIQLTGALSVAISSLVIPGIAAFIAAQYMTTESLWYAIVALGCAQLYRIWLATRDFWTHASISDSATFNRLRLIYALYLLTTLFVFHSVYVWTRPYIELSDYAGLVGDLLNLFVGRIIISGIVMSIAAAAFLKDLTDRHVPALDDVSTDDVKDDE